VSAPEAPALPDDHPIRDGRTASSALVRALRGDKPGVRPIWFMRQAGRSLPEYRRLREGTEMLDACLSPELASEITLQPVRRHGVDAAIFFSDIVVPVKLAGLDVRIVPGRGPVIDSPIRSAADVLRLPPLDPESLAPIRDAVGRTVAELGSTPLIAFGGAPYTLASYLIEGGPSKDQLRARAMMYADPHSWAALLNWCADITGTFIRTQVDAGASAAQLFDSWVGSLSRRDYQRRVAPHSERAFSALRGAGVPRIHFGVDSAAVLDLMAGMADAVGVDWRLPLDQADELLGGRYPLQGNIDPALLSAPWAILEAHVRDVLDRGAGAPAHIVNLGHGVPPDTDPDVLTRVVALVHELG
jgi:uroporphyrinogen decarboxylase